MKWIKKILSWSRNELNRSDSPRAENAETELSVAPLHQFLKTGKVRPDSTRITLSQHLGRGGFGCVFLGCYQGRRVAVKRLQTMVSEISIEHLQEIVILRSISHPNIPRYYGSFVNAERAVFLVMELVEGFSLSKLCDPSSAEAATVSDTDKLYLSWQLWCALAYLHSKHIYHIDIKPDNIMISWDMTAKLVDFGLSRYEADISVSRSCNGNGTWVYWAPEKPIEGRESPGKADTWSLGLSLAEAYAKQFPFLLRGEVRPSRVEHQFQYYQLLHDRPDLQSLAFWDAIPNESMRELVALSLVWDYRLRPSARSLEEHAYAHLRKNLSLQSIDSVPSHLNRRLHIRTLKRRQKELVPSASKEILAVDDWDQLFDDSASSSSYGTLISRAESSEDLMLEMDMEDAKVGCCATSCFPWPS